MPAYNPPRSNTTVDVRDFEYLVTSNNWAPAFNAAMASLPDDGGTIVGDNVLYRITEPIIPPHRGIVFSGNGRRWVKLDDLPVAGSDGGFGIFSDHTGNAFELYSSNGCNGFQLKNMSVVGVPYSSGDAVAWIQDDATFTRNYTFSNITVVGFVHAFHVTKEAGQTSGTIGVVTIERCQIGGNGWIFVADDGYVCGVNGFWFRHNDAGNNGYGEGSGGISLMAIDAEICANVLEGQSDPVSILALSQSVIVSGNYFEANIGTACINVYRAAGVTIASNYYGSVATDYKVLIGASDAVCHDPYFATSIFNSAPPFRSTRESRSNTVPASTDDPLFFMWAGDPIFGGTKDVHASSVLSYSTPEIVDGNQVNTYLHSIPAGSSGIALQTAYGLYPNPEVGQWIVVNFLLRLNDDESSSDPYIILSMNNTDLDGSSEGLLAGYGAYRRIGEWTHVCAAIRAHEAGCNSLGIRIYPYGSYPPNAETITANISQAYVHIANDINDIEIAYEKTARAFVNRAFVSIPAPSSANELAVYASPVAGRMMLTQATANEAPTPLQASLGAKHVGIYSHSGSSSNFPGTFGILGPFVTGTATARTPATTNMFTRALRLGSVSSTSAGTCCGFRAQHRNKTIGTGTGLGGFFFRLKFGASDAEEVAGARMFCGISASTSAPSNIEPDTMVNAIGVCQLSSSGNLHFYCAGSSATTAVDLGSSFPIEANVDWYDLALYADPNTSTVSWQVVRLNTGDTAIGEVSTGLPSSTMYMNLEMWRCNNATALAVGVDMGTYYIESEN